MLEIILATSLKSFFWSIIIIIFLEKQKSFPSSVLNNTTVGFWTDPALTSVTQTHEMSDLLSGQKKTNQTKNKYI